MSKPKFNRLSVETVPVNSNRGSCHKIGPLPVSSSFKNENCACIYADGIRVGIDESLPVARELRAYADLFAASPELYEALRAVESFVTGGVYEWQHLPPDHNRAKLLTKIRAALAKAGGQ